MHVLNVIVYIGFLLFINTLFRWSASLPRLSIMHLIVLFAGTTGIKFFFFGKAVNFDPFSLPGWPRRILLLALGLLCVGVVLRIMHWKNGDVMMLFSVAAYTAALIMSFVNPSSRTETESEILDDNV